MSFASEGSACGSDVSASTQEVANLVVILLVTIRQVSPTVIVIKSRTSVAQDRACVGQGVKSRAVLFQMWAELDLCLGRLNVHRDQ